jgi:hypothetical protein
MLARRYLLAGLAGLAGGGLLSRKAAAVSITSTGSTPIAVGDTPPANPSQGNLWFDSVGAQLYVSYNDGNSSQWVVAVNNSPSIPVGAAALPLISGIAAVGTSVKWAREDHVHPSGGVGVIDGSNAAAGNVGEYLTATGGTVSGSSGVTIDLITLALTAGDWDVWGSMIAAGSGSSTFAQVTLSTVANTAGSFGTQFGITGGGGISNGNSIFNTGVGRFNFSSTTTVRVVGQLITASPSMIGAIFARRRR